ncbi:carbohydrate kinase [Hazenella coriacea]|uniref:Carbohydrate kinase n=1 Tax=Hazenella coriacea TaxID=1179467 RepID=A0A4V2UUV1_9BACL|nr:carbohydrate kinase [Hazenella coriacea]
MHVPLLLDADALNILADHPLFHSVRSRYLVTVCTPHPGECARLLQTTISSFESARPQATMELTKKIGAIVVLKGRYTIIAFPNGN